MREERLGVVRGLGQRNGAQVLRGAATKHVTAEEQDFFAGSRVGGEREEIDWAKGKDEDE